MVGVKRAVEASPTPGVGADLKPLYLEALTLVERLHRRLLDVIKDEFDRSGRSDVNSVQALLLFNIGESELTAGELRTRGYYLGSNVSYNLKKLVEMGYIHHQRSRMDRRSVRVSLTDKGREVADLVNGLYERHIRSIDQVGGIAAEDFKSQSLAPTAGALLDRPDPLSALIRFRSGSDRARRLPGPLRSTGVANRPRPARFAARKFPRNMKVPH